MTPQLLKLADENKSLPCVLGNSYKARQAQVPTQSSGHKQVKGFRVGRSLY